MSALAALPALQIRLPQQRREERAAGADAPAAVPPAKAAALSSSAFAWGDQGGSVLRRHR